METSGPQSDLSLNTAVVRTILEKFLLDETRNAGFSRGVIGLSGGVDSAVTAYLAAGADCVYPIVCPTDSIAVLVERIDGPVNVLLTPNGPQPEELERLGVARVTWGGGLAALAYAEAHTTAPDGELSAVAAWTRP